MSYANGAYLQEEVLDEVDFELSHDKVLEDHDWPELIEDE